MTLVEKIIKNHTDAPPTDIYPGNIVWVSVDLATARDYAGPQVIKLFEENYPDAKKDCINARLLSIWQ